ncbi:MAG: zinc ribbon domain-containing protein [Anaerolineae bacterium]|nr:zinc ribbon domain-containing protein [Anaerolineae bacterium]
MPLYEYRCNACGQNFDKMVRFSEAQKLPECPFCHSQDTRKQISLTGFSTGTSGNTLSSGGSCGASGRFT